MAPRRPALTLALVMATIVAAACTTATPSGRWSRRATPPVEPPPSELETLVEAYHETGDWTPLAAWVDAHAGEPEASLWREVVALRRYESVSVVPAANVAGDVGAMARVADRYEGTVGGRLAQAAVAADGVRALTEPPLNPRLLAFLAGDDRWAYGENGDPLMPDVDLAAFRQTHEDGLRDGLITRLLDEGCEAHVGYCMWWVRHHPDDARTGAIKNELKDIWYRRGHPHWEGRQHANCAFHCARDCREDPDLPSDRCYPACYARC